MVQVTLAILVVGSVASFLLAFGIGANDVSEVFSHPTPLHAVHLPKVSCAGCQLVWDFSGEQGADNAAGHGHCSSLRGSRGCQSWKRWGSLPRVSDTLVRSISRLDAEQCWGCGLPNGRMLFFMLGMACALVSGALFLLVATCCGMPVSTTHAIAGAVLGMTAAGAGFACIRWGYPGMVSIVASWFISPVVAGIFSGAVLLACRRWVFKAPNPLQRVLALMPLLFGSIVGTVLLLVLLQSELTAAWPLWLKGLAALAAVMLIAAAVQGWLMPRMRQWIYVQQGTKQAADAESGQLDLSNFSALPSLDHEPPAGPVDDAHVKEAAETHSDAPAARHSPEQQRWLSVDAAEEESLLAHATLSTDQEQGAVHAPTESQDAEAAFMYLQVLTACLKSYAHGSNDAANAAGPQAAIISLYSNGLDACDAVGTPVWVMAVAGAGIVLGLATLGHRVMKTVGQDLTQVNFSRGFAIELGSTLSVVMASVLGMPVSSTHCQIGSVVTVGILEHGVHNVQWSLLGKIAVTWLFTVPVAAIASAMLFLMSQPLV